jgi:hypothetical protein
VCLHAKFSPNGQFLAVGTKSGSLLIFIVIENNSEYSKEGLFYPNYMSFKRNTSRLDIVDLQWTKVKIFVANQKLELAITDGCYLGQTVEFIQLGEWRYYCQNN